MSDSSPQAPLPITISRTRIGLIAAACLLIAIGLRFGRDRNENLELWVAGFGRAGLLMGALWIAMPGKSLENAAAKLTPQTALGVLLAVVAVCARPQYLLRMIPVFVALGTVAHYLKPKPKPPAERPDRSSWRS